MKKELIIILTLTTVGLSSCGIYTNYHRSETLPVDSLYRDTPISEETYSLATLSWRELFTDSYLTKWIELGLEKNTNLQTAHLKVEEAEASLLSSKLSFLPSLFLTPQGSLSSYDGSKPSKAYSLGASAEWQLDIFGSLRNAKKGASASLEQTKAYEQAVQTQLIATIADSYYSLLMLDRQLAITRETAKNWEENLRMMKAMKRAGQRNEAAVAQAEASKLSADASVLSLERQIHELENSFSTLLGIVPQQIERGDLSDSSFNAELSVGIPLEMINKRPDVRQAEYSLTQAFYATNQARSAFYPQITLSGSAGWTNNAGSAIINPGNWLLSAVGSLTQPIFNRGKNIAQLKIAKAQQEEALLAFQQKLLNAGAEVNDALTQWQTAQKRLEIDKQQIESLKSAVRSTQLLMQHGNTNYLEVLTAQQTLLQAQLTEVSDKYTEIQGVIGLYHSLGGGVD